MKPETFDPSKDIPSLADKVFLVTGGTSGLGKEAILALSKKRPAAIYLTGRNSKAAADVILSMKSATDNPSFNITFIECDHTSFVSVENATNLFLSKSQRLDVLFCNAGVMGIDPGLTKDGYENQFGINQMAHALMVKMLLPTLQSTAKQTGDVRVVFESSVGFRWTPSGGIRLAELKTTQDYWFAGRWVRYGQIKLANVVYASELAQRYPEITSISVHPGVIYTNLWTVNWSLLNRIFVKLATLGQPITVEQGSHTPCWAMTAPKEKLTGGAFYEGVGVVGYHFSTDLQGKIGIVTGGASGIGLAAAKILSSLGAKVHIFDIVPWEQADADSNPEINFHACDVTSWIELRNAFKSVGQFDLVFANAGISERVNFFAETLDDGGDLQEPPLEQMDVNFKAMIYSIKLAWFGMKKQKSGGSIVLTSSATAYVPWQSLAVYSSAKLAASLIGMVRSLRSLLPCDNITINAVAPGATVTNLLPTHLHNAVKAIGAPISSAHTVAKALVFSATAMEARRVEDYGKDKGEEREEVRRWNGRVILVLGDQYTEVEEEYAGLRSRCLGEENHRLFLAQQAATDGRQLD